MLQLNRLVNIRLSAHLRHESIGDELPLWGQSCRLAQIARG